MSSPSKIPRPRFGEKKQTIAAVGKVYNEKHAPKMEHSSGMPTKVRKRIFYLMNHEAAYLNLSRSHLFIEGLQPHCTYRYYFTNL